MQARKRPAVRLRVAAVRDYVILLRAVMPSGKNKVPMARLREVLTGAGLDAVRTYIQSGNVLARSELAADQVERLVHDEIQRHFGGDLAVLARTPSQLGDILARNPFTAPDPSKLLFTVLAEEPDPDRVAELTRQRFPPDEFAVTPAVVYLHCPQGYGRSKLSNNFFEERLGVAATTRNSRTMVKLVGMSVTPA